MKKYIIVNGKIVIIRSREPSAGKEKVVPSKKLYNRKKEKEILTEEKNVL